MHGSIKLSEPMRLSPLDPPSVTASSQAIQLPQTSPAWLIKPPGATQKLFWLYLGPFIVLHLLVVLAFVPWLFSWTGVILVFVGNYVFGLLGINLCYHRILTHQGLVVPKWLEHTLAILGVCNLQDAPARWVGVHRMHHQFSDERRDPHTPLVDFLWRHVGWRVYQNKYFGTADFYDRYARDLLQDRCYYRAA